MSTHAGAIRARGHRAHPLMHEVLEVALVLAIAGAGIGILATIREGSVATPPGELAAMRARVDATSLVWRGFKEIDPSSETPARLTVLPVPYVAPAPGSEPTAYRAAKEVVAGDPMVVVLPAAVEPVPYEAPAPSSEALDYRAAKEMSAG